MPRPHVGLPSGSGVTRTMRHVYKHKTTLRARRLANKNGRTRSLPPQTSVWYTLPDLGLPVPRPLPHRHLLPPHRCHLSLNITDLRSCLRRWSTQGMDLPRHHHLPGHQLFRHCPRPIACHDLQQHPHRPLRLHPLRRLQQQHQTVATSAMMTIRLPRTHFLRLFYRQSQ